MGVCGTVPENLQSFRPSHWIGQWFVAIGEHDIGECHENHDVQKSYENSAMLFLLWVCCSKWGELVFYFLLVCHNQWINFNGLSALKMYVQHRFIKFGLFSPPKKPENHMPFVKTKNQQVYRDLRLR